MNNKRFMIVAPSSGSGKTMLVCGLLATLKKRGEKIKSFKCGPDYIDPLFHKTALGIGSCNLDGYFLEEESLRNLFEKESKGYDWSVLEGVMGYYDGIAGISTKASSFHVAKITNTPSILVIDGKKSSVSILALLKGFLTFESDSMIAGVILNRTSSLMGERLKPLIEEMGVKYLGAFPVCDEANLESRHLGLVLPEEQKGWSENLDRLSKKIEAYIDLERLESIATCKVEESFVEEKSIQNNRRIAVAKDEAFCFYYDANIELLESMGWEVIDFSPIHDAVLPEQIDAILFGGGYPELHGKMLSDNTSMIQSIKDAYKNGVKILAECGGFMYLHEELEVLDGSSYNMVGIIKGRTYPTGRLSRFGYIEIETELGKIKGHEFHYWESTNPGESAIARKPMSKRTWKCMNHTKQLLVGYPHLYYPSNPQMIADFLNELEVSET